MDFLFFYDKRKKALQYVEAIITNISSDKANVKSLQNGKVVDKDLHQSLMIKKQEQ